MKFGVLVVSDRCSRGEAEDTSGAALVAMLQEHFGGESSVELAVVPDEVEDIQAQLKKWTHATGEAAGSSSSVALLLTTGGTGFAPRDVTPEATKPLLEKECPGIVAAMLNASLQITPFAMLARPAAGIRGSSLIVNLPGSKKGATENLAAILPAMKHAIALVQQSAGKDQH